MVYVCVVVCMYDDLSMTSGFEGIMTSSITGDRQKEALNFNAKRLGSIALFIHSANPRRDRTVPRSLFCFVLVEVAVLYLFLLVRYSLMRSPP